MNGHYTAKLINALTVCEVLTCHTPYLANRDFIIFYHLTVACVYIMVVNMAVH